MKKKTVNIALLIALSILSLVLMLFADLVQTDFGRIRIENGSIATDLGDISYKLYIPGNASVDFKAPAVLLLHH